MREMVHLGIYSKCVLGLILKDRSNESQKRSLKTDDKWTRMYTFSSHYINTLFMQSTLLGDCFPW